MSSHFIIKVLIYFLIFVIITVSKEIKARGKKMTKYKFQRNFWWGSAASGPQTEGRIQGDHQRERIFGITGMNKNQKSFQSKLGRKKKRVRFILNTVKTITIDERKQATVLSGHLSNGAVYCKWNWGK